MTSSSPHSDNYVDNLTIADLETLIERIIRKILLENNLHSNIHEVKVETLKFSYDETATPLSEIISEISARVPAEEWAKVPADASENIDKYLYGTLQGTE